MATTKTAERWAGDLYTERWEGGYIRKDSQGRRVYVIRKQWRGKRYKVSTGCHTLKAAMEQLKRFEADPDAYTPAASIGTDGKATREALYLTDQLGVEFLTYCDVDKGSTEQWVGKQKAYLLEWAKVLEGIDLRRVDLEKHILPHAGTHRQRISVIKAFYSWLRKVRFLVTPAEDPVMDRLVAPPIRPEQWHHTKVIPKAHVEAVLAWLRKQGAKTDPLMPSYAQALHLQMGSGWHVTEVQRFAATGSIEDPPAAQAKDCAAVLVCPQSKAGDALRTGVSDAVAESARKLRAHGHLQVRGYYQAIADACTAIARAKPRLKMEPFTPGRLRHTVATWAVERGAQPAQVSAFLNHKSVSTTKRFYSSLAVAPKVPTLA